MATAPVKWPNNVTEYRHSFCCGSVEEKYPVFDWFLLMKESPAAEFGIDSDIQKDYVWESMNFSNL
jgi:hypothetical protein